MSVTAIIPAYNEEKYLGGVLNVLLDVELVSQIIVVDDGSTDRTSQVARGYGVDVLELPYNKGKAGAMAAGLNYAKEDNILFLDADLLDLHKQNIYDLVIPVINDDADMTVGIFGSGRPITDVAQLIAPFLSGQRCIKKKWLSEIDKWADAGFGVEVALTAYAHRNKLRIKNIELPGMSHVMKEEKLGVVRGFAFRMKMYWEIAKKIRIGG